MLSFMLYIVLLVLYGNHRKMAWYVSVKKTATICCRQRQTRRSSLRIKQFFSAGILMYVIEHDHADWQFGSSAFLSLRLSLLLFFLCYSVFLERKYEPACLLPLLLVCHWPFPLKLSFLSRLRRQFRWQLRRLLTSS